MSSSTVASKLSPSQAATGHAKAPSSVAAASTTSNKNKKAASEAASAAPSRAPTTTTVLASRVKALETTLQDERGARQRAEAELKHMMNQLAALEQTLGLTPPPNLPSNKKSS